VGVAEAPQAELWGALQGRLWLLVLGHTPEGLGGRGLLCWGGLGGGGGAGGEVGQLPRASEGGGHVGQVHQGRGGELAL
jgi:hypothetical protein